MKKLVLALVALAAIVAVATPALADYNFYGSVRLKTQYVYNDVGNANSDSTALQFATNSRFGAKATTGDIGGRLEMGFYDASTAYLRLLYGTYKMDAGTLLVGQTYTGYFSNPGSVYKNEDGFNGYGAIYDGRLPQISFTMPSGLYMAAIKNSQTGVAGNKVLLPKLNIGFKNKAGALSYNVGIAYQTYDIAQVNAVTAVPFVFDPATGGTLPGGVKAVAFANKRTVNSYLAYADIKFAQDQMSARFKPYFGQNLTNFGIGTKTRKTSAYMAAANRNVNSFGAVAELGFDIVKLGASYNVDDQVKTAAKSTKTFGAFINATFKPAKGFTIVPELVCFDNSADGFDVDGMDEAAAYVKWQMDF